MWKIHNIVVFVTFTVIGVLFLPVYLVFGFLLILLTALMLFYDLPLNVHVASIRLWVESFFCSTVNSSHYSNRTLSTRQTQLHSNGVLNNHSVFLSDKQRSSPNLISPSKLCKEQQIPGNFTMHLSNCNLHSTPIEINTFVGYKDKSYAGFKDGCTIPWCDQNPEVIHSPKNVPKNVQTVAGPLLASKKFNTCINSELVADVNSSGFSSRVAQKGGRRENVTHQAKYSGVGVFPLVQLTSRSPKNSFIPRNNSSTSKSVRVRIAPPDNSPFGGLENTILSGGVEGDDSMKSVLQVLKEMSRKRIHSQVDEDDDDKVKRQKKENCDENTPKTYLDSGLQNKRGRDDSPRSSDEVKRQRRQMSSGSNEIMSSLSSSLAVKPPHLVKGTKRKAHVVDWSRSNTPVSGKLLKVNVSPVQSNNCQTPVATSDEGSMQISKGESREKSDLIEDMSEKSQQIFDSKKSIENSAVTVEANGNDCVRIEAGQRRVLARGGDVKEVPMQDINWHDITPVAVTESAPVASISVKRIKDPGKRLKDMLAAIDGSDEIVTDVTSMSPSVLAILKTAKCSSKQKSNQDSDKSVTSELVKSPVSILKTPGTNDPTKSVRFYDDINTTEEKSNKTLSPTLYSSPQTGFATVVSHSINTSISSASETSSLSSNSFIIKNADGSHSPSLTFALPNSTSMNVIHSKTPATPNESVAVSQSPHNLFSTVVSETNPKESTGLFSGSTLGTSSVENSFINQLTKATVPPISNAGVTFSSGFKSPESTQTLVNSTNAIGAGLFGSTSNKSATPETTSVTFSSVSSTSSTLPVPTAEKTNSLIFGTNMKSKDLSVTSSTSDSAASKSVIKPFTETNTINSGFSFGNGQDANNAKPNVSFFGGFSQNSLNTNTTASTISLPTGSGSLPTGLFTTSGSTKATSASTIPNTMFSFGSNSTVVTTSQMQSPSLFNTVTSQPPTQPTNIFGGVSASTSQYQLQKNVLTTSVASQPISFGNVTNTTMPGTSLLPNPNTSNTAANSAPASFSSFQTATSSTEQLPVFGNNNIFSSIAPNKSESFASASVFGSPAAVVSSAPSLFNSFSSATTQNSGFGVTASNAPSTLSISTSTTSTPVFGQTTNQSLFSFGSTAATTQSTLFGANVNPVTTTAPSVVNGPPSFSSFNNNTSLESDKGKQATFGSSSFQAPAFNFGSSPAPSQSSFAFNSPATNVATTTAAATFASPFKPPEQKPFGFDSPQPATQNANTIFSFGQNNNSPAQPSSAATFQFGGGSSSGAVPQPAGPGVFNFGAGTNTTNSPFGTGINTPAFNIGAGGSGGSAMFNIGSGSSSARPRAVSRPRRKNER